jgi:CheY-like chemotaxis protein/putative methionine-R-sulfoxide reductase with GAF domain/PAS domain-containing protein
MVPERRRILVLEGKGHEAGDLLEQTQPDWDLIRVDSTARGLALLSAEHFDGVYADTHDPAVWSRAENLLQAQRILEALPDGVAVVTPDLRVTWANATFDQWCGAPSAGRGFYEALGSPEILGPDYCPFHTALAGKTVSTRLHYRGDRYLELHVTPVHDSEGRTVQLISLGRDITAEVQHEQKLEALYQAGRELTALTPEELSDMSIEERVELLKQNIRRLTHDLLHYDVIEIRLLDPHTCRLEPLLQEGMSQGARNRVLHARAEGNGITGFVTATGKSYLCPDTAKDPLYVEGAEGARSSLTVPLIVQDQIIGTFNVESPRLNAFAEEDLKFVEIFGREIAAALRTLQLLTAEKHSTASQSVEAISREVALPVDEILASATAVLDRYIGHEPEIADKLKGIIAGARSIKQSIQKVGEDMGAAKSSGRAGEPAHPALKGLRLLVADNDERVRRSAHGILGRFGCIVETARDGQEALTMARLSNYDAVLADIRLPDVAGYEIYHRLCEAQPQAQVILMTSYGYDPSHSIVKARQEGLRTVLFKPFRVDQLLDVLEHRDRSPVQNAKCGA